LLFAITALTYNITVGKILESLYYSSDRQWITITPYSFKGCLHS